MAADRNFTRGGVNQRRGAGQDNHQECECVFHAGNFNSNTSSRSSESTNQPFALALHKSRFADAHHSRPWAGGRALRPAPDGRFRGNGLDITHQTLPPLWRGERMDNDLAQLGMQSRE